MSQIWTPVNKGMPREGGSYLITQMGTTRAYQRAKQPVVQMMTYLCGRDGKDGCFLSDRVLAWMPKPDPYMPSAVEKIGAGYTRPLSTREEIAELEEKIFWSPFEEMAIHNGKRFKVLRELDDEVSRSAGCIEFDVRLEDGAEVLARLEELNGDYLSDRAACNGSITPADEYEICELYPPLEAGTKCFLIFVKGCSGRGDLRYLIYAKSLNEALGCFFVEQSEVSYNEITYFLEL